MTTLSELICEELQLHWDQSQSFILLFRFLHYLLQLLNEEIEILDFLFAPGGREAENTFLCSLILPQPAENRPRAPFKT